MSRKLTTTELAEPDVEFAIDLRKWSALPDDVRRDVQAYSTQVWHSGGYTLTMAAYRFRELEERVKTLGSQLPPLPGQEGDEGIDDALR